MKDRYLFRAKRKENGEWIEGLIWKSFGELGIMSSNGVSSSFINPTTICQCTGRNDKNGKLIYENDIMVAHYDEENPEHGTYAMVAWREYGWVTVENNSDDPCPLDDFTIKHFEVVGNIFDNPELLEWEGER